MAHTNKKPRLEPISTSGDDIICNDSKVTASDERLKGIMLHLYEKARDDARSFKIYRYYSEFFTIAFTLLIALVTTNFKDFPLVNGRTLEKIAWIVFAFCLLIGFIFLFANANRKHSNENKERDKAVQEALKGLIAPQMQSMSLGSQINSNMKQKEPQARKRDGV